MCVNAGVMCWNGGHYRLQLELGAPLDTYERGRNLHRPRTCLLCQSDINSDDELTAITYYNF